MQGGVGRGEGSRRAKRNAFGCTTSLVIYLMHDRLCTD